LRKPSKAEINAAIRAAQQKLKKPWNPAEILTPHQLKIFQDKSVSRALEGTRQFGKSLIAAVEVIDASLQKPKSESAFLDFDITHTEKVLLPYFEAFLDEYDVKATIINGELHFENGSVVYLFSGRKSEVKKLQGLKFAMLILDEVQDSDALDEILKLVRPALMRHRGRILLCGIPGRMRGIGPWWDITNGNKSHAWSQHRGHMNDNPYLTPEAREEQRAAALIDYGSDQDPDYLRHWCGLWPTEDNALRMFRYSREKNSYEGAPPICVRHSLGLDPGGTVDAEAVVMVGFGNGDGLIWHVDEDVSEKRQGGGWDITGERVGPMCERWNPERRYYDYGSVKKGSQALLYAQDKRVFVEPVPEKDPEQESVRINRLFQQGRLWIKKDSKLEKDLLYTVWDAKSLAAGKPVQNKSAYKQNACDALRSAMWGVDGYAEPPTPAAVPLTDEQQYRKKLEAAISPKQTIGPKDRYGAILKTSSPGPSVTRRY